MIQQLWLRCELADNLPTSRYWLLSWGVWSSVLKESSTTDQHYGTKHVKILLRIRNVSCSLDLLASSTFRLASLTWFGFCPNWFCLILEPSVGTLFKNITWDNLLELYSVCMFVFGLCRFWSLRSTYWNTRPYMESDWEVRQEADGSKRRGPWSRTPSPPRAAVPVGSLTWTPRARFLTVQVCSWSQETGSSTAQLYARHCVCFIRG